MGSLFSYSSNYNTYNFDNSGVRNERRTLWYSRRNEERVSKVNYHCPVCMETGKIPNIAGRFHLINETQCKCNGCQTIFEKEIIYRPVVLSKAEYATPTPMATVVIGGNVVPP